MQGKVNFIIRLEITIFFIVIGGVATAAGKIIYVDDEAPVTGRGSSWTDAFCCLQDALAEADVGDEIRVAQGVYKPDRRVEVSGRIGTQVKASGDSTAAFELIEGITMKGGYAGFGKSNPDARDIELYETVLSGDLYGNDMDVNNPGDTWEATGRAENSYHVVTVGGGVEDAVAILDGFTITGGNANVSSYYNGNGGGLYNPNCTIRISNCNFTRNLALFDGGGIYNDQGDLSLTNCKFIKNLVISGGGAGIYNYRSSMSQDNCAFIENSAQYGEGGGINNDECDPNITNCIFIENSARAGGGIYNRYSSPALTNCVFRANSVRDQGGGVHNFNRNTSSPILRNCLFTGNSAGYSGGGIYNYWGGPVLTNCTFVWNSAENGNALSCRSDHERNIVTLTSCILWDGGGEIWSSELSIINIFYSNVCDGWFGEGNIDADPLFADPNGPDNIPGTEDDDLRLAPSSPCIDAGDPGYSPGTNETDLDGNPRVVSGRVDMGAYEFPGIIYVDKRASNDSWQTDFQENGSEAHPFHTIQKAINIAKDRQTVLVRPGVYESINFEGKAITVAGTEGAAVIEPPLETIRTGGAGRKDMDGVTFHTGEGPGSVIKNFIIRYCNTAISLNYGSSPTIRNLTIVDNDFGIAAYEDSNPDVSNCIFFNNTNGDLFQCQARYSCFESETPGAGNISGDPLFVDPAGGDYHLMSEGWRWNVQNGSWTWDFATSPCIDAGDPASPLGDEPMSVSHDPDNKYGINLRINMGAYGGTAQASLSPVDQNLPGQASGPSPADGAVDVEFDVILSWTPGANADSHDVYFGTDGSLEFMGNQSMAEFDPGRLDVNTTYFWRIDEINSNGTRTGVPWSFTTGTAAGPTPPPKGRTCFVAETDVWVDGTLVSISKAGERRCVGRSDAPAKNSSITLPYLGKVEELQEHEGTFECYEVLLRGGNSIGVAGNHYFLTESGGWVAVQNLKKATKLQTPNGPIGIVSVTKRPTTYVGKVYNLKVEGSDRYLVGNDAIIVRDY